MRLLIFNDEILKKYQLKIDDDIIKFRFKNTFLNLPKNIIADADIKYQSNNMIGIDIDSKLASFIMLVEKNFTIKECNGS
jgi:hypothetical protein